MSKAQLTPAELKAAEVKRDQEVADLRDALAKAITSNAKKKIRRQLRSKGFYLSRQPSEAAPVVEAPKVEAPAPKGKGKKKPVMAA